MYKIGQSSISRVSKLGVATGIGQAGVTETLDNMDDYGGGRLAYLIGAASATNLYALGFGSQANLDIKPVFRNSDTHGAAGGTQAWTDFGLFPINLERNPIVVCISLLLLHGDE